MNVFAHDLKQLRLSRGALQKAVAIGLGVDRTYLCQLESGKRPPPCNAEFFERLRAVLDLSQTELLDLRNKAGLVRELGRSANQAPSPLAAEITTQLYMRMKSLKPAQWRAIQAVLEMG